MPLNPQSWPVNLTASWYTGSGAPSASLGVDGDLYLDTATGNVYQNGNGTWSIIANVGGGGATWTSGKGPPSAASGNNGDFYLQTGNGAIWTKISGTWTKVSTVATGASTGSAPAQIVKQADTSVANNTALANDPHLAVTLVNGGQYWVVAWIVYASPAGGTTPGLKIGAGEDGTDRGVHFGQGFSTAGSPTTASTSCNTANSTSWQTQTFNRILNLQFPYWAGGGTLAIRWAQNTSGANPTIVRAGSILQYTRIL